MAEQSGIEAREARRQRRQTLGAWLLPATIAVGGIVVALLLGRLDAESRASEAQVRVTSELAMVRARLEGQIRATFDVTEGIVHLLRLDGGEMTPQRFDGMARQAIEVAPHIRSIALAPDDVVRQVYPRAGNEKVLGTDFRTLPDQYPAVQRAHETRSALLAGPVELVQGGRGLIQRRPVFLGGGGQAGRYWGTVSIVADVDRLLGAAGLDRVAGMRLALRGRDGKGESGAMILGDAGVFQQAPASMTVPVPGGAWQLAAIPAGGWPAVSPWRSPLFAVALANTVLLTLFAALLARRNRIIRERNAGLSREVEERRLAEASLAQSEARFRTLFGRSPDPAWIARRDGSCADCNDAALAVFGFKDFASFENITPADVSPPLQPDGQPSADKARLMLETALARGLHRFEWLHRRADGRLFPAEVTLCAMALDGEAMIYAVVRDISERKEATAALRNQQALVQAVVDNAPVLIYMFDPDGRLQWCNRFFELAVGRPRRTIEGKPRESFMGAAAALRYRQEDETVIADGKTRRFEDREQWSEDVRVYLTTKCLVRGPGGEPTGVLGISSDITEMKQASEQLRLAGVVLDNTADGVIITDHRGLIVSVNKAFTAITGYGADEVIGQTPRFLRSGRQEDEDFFRAVWDCMRRDGFWRGEAWNRRKDGTPYPEWLTINPVPDADGIHTNYVAVFSDISAIKHSQAELERLAHFDSLTGLPNRALFLDRLQHALDHALRDGGELAVLLLDLDSFKTVNDSLGHPVGDVLLQQAAERFRDCVRQEDTVARLGGDEFAIIIGQLGQGADAVSVVKKLLQALQEPFDLDGTAALVTTSIGIAIAPTDGRTPEELVRNADAAMYGAKEGGRNGYRFYQSDMTLRVQERLTRERALRRALDAGEFEVWYQPKLELGSGRPDGAEALLRWSDPARGWVSPAEFIPLAERTGLIIPLGERMLDMVCRQLGRWRELGLSVGRVAVNVAVLEIERSDYVATLRQALARYGLPAEVLEVEVTESLIMDSPEHTRTTLCALRQLGVNLAVDDFGTGYSSLAYLKLLPINHLKIDQAFVSDLPHDSNDAAITRAIIAMGHSLGFRVTAEGIETVEQLEFLRQAGCDQGQGYLFGRPMPAAEFEAWLLPQQAVAD